MNQVILIGRLTRDPELSYQSGSGKAYCKFTLAVNDIVSKEKKTTFFDCVCFDKQAEAIASHVTKGQQLAVYGKININKYQDRAGINREKVQILVNDNQMLTEPNNNSNNLNQNHTNNTENNKSYSDGAFMYGEIPF